ncbi:unnamed protein product [Linum trigynum]|uniref:Major facilitator superfamily (MFS) profile domain-containing protein n=1 Tax=Linum trigynum TaxID=586398 RepID=A0AAV2FYP2_9ROSI
MARVVRFRDEVEIIPPSSSSCFPAAACNLLKMAGNKITGAVTHLFHGAAHCVHSVATFSGNVWWDFKTVIRPSPMSSLAWAASFPFFLYGYDVAIQESGTSILGDLRLSQTDVTVYLTCTGRAAYGVGAFAAGVAANYVGRRYVLASVGVFYTAGALVVAFTTSYVWSTVGRALACFGVGMGLLVGPIFIVETAPSTTRGYHGTFPQVIHFFPK